MKREGIDTCVCAVSLCVAETPKASIKDQVPPIPIAPFGIVVYGFFRTTFLETAVYITIRWFNSTGILERKTAKRMYYALRDRPTIILFALLFLGFRCSKATSNFVCVIKRPPIQLPADLKPYNLRKLCYGRKARAKSGKACKCDKLWKTYSGCERAWEIV